MPYPYDNEEKEQPRAKLATNRSMWKLMLFSFLTCGIYAILFFIPFSFDLDRAAPKRDRSKTVNFILVYILSIFTWSIVLDIWLYSISARIEDGLAKRNIDYNFTRGTFWGWFFFGSLIFVGPFVYYHKLCRAMNLLCADYNERPIVEEN